MGGRAWEGGERPPPRGLQDFRICEIRTQVTQHEPNLATCVKLATQGTREMALMPLQALLPWVGDPTEVRVDWLARAGKVFKHLQAEQLQLLLTSGVLYYVRAQPKELVYIPGGWVVAERADRQVVTPSPTG